MSEQVSAAATPEAISAIRRNLIGDRISITQAAAAFNVTERAVYGVIASRSIPFVKIFGTRYIAPEDLRRAMVEGNAEPARRGRPRKHSLSK